MIVAVALAQQRAVAVRVQLPELQGSVAVVVVPAASLLGIRIDPRDSVVAVSVTLGPAVAVVIDLGRIIHTVAIVVRYPVADLISARVDV